MPRAGSDNPGRSYPDICSACSAEAVDDFEGETTAEQWSQTSGETSKDGKPRSQTERKEENGRKRKRSNYK